MRKKMRIVPIAALLVLLVLVASFGQVLFVQKTGSGKPHDGDAGGDGDDDDIPEVFDGANLGSGTPPANHTNYKSYKAPSVAVAGKWAAKTPMPILRTDTPNGAVGSDLVDNIFEFGGENTNKSYTMNLKYDPRTDNWSVRAPMSETAPGYGREEFGLASWHGKLFAMSGHTWTLGGQFTALKINEMYDPQGNNWTTKMDVPYGRTYPAAATVGDRIYLIGGWRMIHGTADTIVQQYDTINDTWYPPRAPMPTARTGLSAAVVDGKIYCIGGFDGLSGTVNVNEMYDPVMDSWTTKAPMPTARGWFACAVLNHKIYCIGGGSGNPPNTISESVNEVYDPGTDTWSTDTAMPTARQQVGASCVNDRIYVMGGWDGGAKNQNEMFVPPTVDATGSAFPNPVYSGSQTLLSVKATDGVDPMVGATVTFTDKGKGGSFGAVTDHANGTYTVDYTPPVVATKTYVTIFANISKTGYGYKEIHVFLTVNPPQVPEFPYLPLALAPTVLMAATIVAKRKN